MTVKYKTVITKAGAIKLAAATVPNGKKVNFTAMAIGDGGGTLPVPDASQTKLVNEVWRHTLNKISQDNRHQNYVIAELLIPPETGGFWMREMGLYDDTGTLIAVGNMAESYKPELAEGSGRAQTVRMVIMVSDIESVELTIDTSTVMATQDYVDDKLAEHEQSRRHPDATLTEKGFTQLSNATDSTSETLAATPKAVKTAYDLANGKYTAQDATTAQKGIVQLSSATDSTSETLAATPKAVKTAYDLANGKYTAQDATTAQKGIVQLSSATDSASETLAATPKAVKAANDNANGRVPSGRKVNGRALAEDINITSQDIFNGQAVLIGNAADLNSFTTPGLYYQSSNAQAEAGTNYPEKVAGSLEVYKHAGVTQIYRIYADSRSYIRIFYNGTWTSWAKQYDAANKPAPSDIGAVAVSGGNYNATFRLGRVETLPTESNMSALYNVRAGEGGVVSGVEFNWYGHKFTVGITRDGSSGTNGLVFQHNGYTRLRIDKDGNLISFGAISSGDKVVAGFGVYDTPGVRVYSSNNPPPQQDLSPYAKRDAITFVGLEANNPIAPYMRQESTGALVYLAQRDWVNGNFATSAWTIANFLQGGLRLASAGVATNGNNDSEFAYAPNGTVVTAVQQKTNYTAVQYRSLQYNIGGNWYTAWVA
ncbi:tail fiber protein [Enterobacter asburiae]|uniref:tail fiber protein n=1 Tax=Enterobacter asburiae TaxID=61645 RepID=UPI001C5B2790|nr:tail fiber protein [Enterobacter asburiae]MBW4211145.1 tail fiber protein [Enterobacter asburiae]